MIEVVPLTAEHLRTFEPETPCCDIPEKQFGKAAVYVENGKPLAICLVFELDGVVEIGLIMSAEARKFPVSLHRFARLMLAGLHILGCPRIRAVGNNPRSVAWLLRLGFVEVDGGGFEKWQTQ